MLTLRDFTTAQVRSLGPEKIIVWVWIYQIGRGIAVINLTIKNVLRTGLGGW